jgi:nickel transport protein
MLRFALVAFAALAVPPFAQAHDLQATVTVGARVKVLAFFDDDLPAQGANVTVFAANGDVLAVGKTDANGVWEWDRPAAGAYKVKVKEGGHITETAFRVEGAAQPDAPPSEFADPRPNKTLGLVLGTAALLGLSAAYWFLRRGRMVR